MKRTIILFLLCMAALAACSVDELPPLSNEPIRDLNGAIIANYPYLWAHSHVTDTTAKQYTRFEFKTYDCTFPMFDNGRKVIVGNIYGGISCLNTDNGSEVWNCKLLDNPADFFTPPILDYFVASTEQWLIINMDGVFVKIDLKNGEILGKCALESNKASRMHRDSDECFYLSGKTDVYRVDCQNMTALKVNIFDDTKIHEYVSVIPYSYNNKKYFFVQEIVVDEIFSDEWNWSSVFSYLLSANKSDTLFNFPKVSVRVIDKFKEIFLSIDDIDNETYLFTGHGFKIFNWDSMNVVLNLKLRYDQIGILSIDQNYRYHEVYDDKLVCHFDNETYYYDEYVFAFREIVDVPIDKNDDGTYYYIKSKNIVRKSKDKTCGSHVIDGIVYLARKDYLIATEFDNSTRLMNMYIGNDNLNVSDNLVLTTDFDDSDSHEHAFGRNSQGISFYTVVTDDNVFCFPCF
ncbi:MAG: hypothetical protein IKI28_10245 [Bacteroidales bacterium]|nr:hypothetical protein [Bacteroidales bacterium]